MFCINRGGMLMCVVMVMWGRSFGVFFLRLIGKEVELVVYVILFWRNSFELLR